MPSDRPETTAGLGDAEAVAAWCVFWAEMPGGPAQGAVAAQVIRAQATEIERLRAVMRVNGLFVGLSRAEMEEILYGR